VKKISAIMKGRRVHIATIPAISSSQI